MSTRLIIEGNAVYEIDEDCQACQNKRRGERMRQASCGCAGKETRSPSGSGGRKEKRQPRSPGPQDAKKGRPGD